jgi:hypothetical protein
MSNSVKSMNVEQAVRDLQGHTLEGFPGEIARLVYLASTRDYNTGQYSHDGLAFRYSEELARTALAEQHREIFRKLVFTSMEDLVQQLDAYMSSSRVPPAEFLEVWRKLEPYRVTIPMDCDALSVELFFSNVRIALAILQARQEMSRNS